MTGAIVIQGGYDVAGDIHVSGSKNAGLALMAATVLACGNSTLQGVPPVSDIHNMARNLQYLGASIKRLDGSLRIDTTKLISLYVPDHLAGCLRASILLLGPLVAQYGYAKLSLPGGCTIGDRPIEEHVRGLEALGARVKVTDDYIEAHATRLQGASLNLQTPSVTGTMNLIMAACLAHGTTHIHNAAREPDVVDLIMCLIKMGAQIEGAGSDHLIISGHGRPLSPYQYKVMEDRIEAGTFLILGAIAGNPLTIHGCQVEYHIALIIKLRAVGAIIDVSGNSVTICKAKQPSSTDIQTGPYPGFPTDLQPQFMVLLSLAQGISEITETVYESRFSQAVGLRAMGADIEICGQIATISGISSLSGTDVSGSDLRATASLVIAAIAARGASVIRGVKYIDRGYHDMERKLQNIGVKITRVHGLDSTKNIDI
ncbi:RNA 3'-terminal phosphate cyclase/enolpyruvate transferase [Penicillium waksmanii]|uniref:RNA 3'-terminal phosphate cyclase/enolpyruvate transferase n=1 Tax=Penicillium waksmanii TaxID=69791 RepID=UPI00254990C3|nr:RNA 3'-terminal phosphate cyclase/enolpyruvate transferase [Penicillium waksmanii]KAJ5984487.1 RNA 3'-terminal phosphate cyclase/enolpyruvate transferase [Penicillium waksmanii]